MSRTSESPKGEEHPPEQRFLFGDLPQESEASEAEVRASSRKLQVSNGYLLEFERLSQLLSALVRIGPKGRITRADIIDETGLPDRSIEALVSMATAMGILKPVIQTLTSHGALLAEHDVFFERQGTLEWCHYRGAGSARNLVWFDVFNRLLVIEEPMTHPEWNTWFRKELAGSYSERTLRKVVQEEVHFVVNGYLEQKLKTLDILEVGDGEVLIPRRHRNIDHLIFAAMLYDFIESHGGRTLEIMELTHLPGSPTVLFQLDADSVRALLETLHNEGLVRYETTHNLDQIRLIPGYGPEELLQAYFRGRKPQRQGEIGGARG